MDFTSPTRKRTPKKSAKNYAHIIKTRTIDWGFEPEAPAYVNSLVADSSSANLVVKTIMPIVLALIVIANN